MTEPSRRLVLAQRPAAMVDESTVHLEESSLVRQPEAGQLIVNL